MGQMQGYNFTERMRRILAMAREEAAGLRHEYVGTEHILLGIIREGDGVAMSVLEYLGADPRAIADPVRRTVQKGMARRETGPDLPYTSRSKKVLELAMAEARDLKHAYVGSEHLLLGLIREEKGIAAQALVDAGVSLDKARAEVLRVLGTETPAADKAPRPAPAFNFTERTRRILAMAREEAAALQHEFVGTEHILLGLIRQGNGIGRYVLEILGGDPRTIADTVGRTVQKGLARPGAGPDLPYTSGAKQVLELAMHETRDLAHDYVGSEHLLLGLIREGKGIAAQVLVGAGVTLDKARAEVARVLGTDSPEADSVRRAAGRVIVRPPQPGRHSPLTIAGPTSFFIYRGPITGGDPVADVSPSFEPVEMILRDPGTGGELKRFSFGSIREAIEFLRAEQERRERGGS